MFSVVIWSFQAQISSSSTQRAVVMTWYPSATYLSTSYVKVSSQRSTFMLNVNATRASEEFVTPSLAINWKTCAMNLMVLLNLKNSYVRYLVIDTKMNLVMINFAKSLRHCKLSTTQLRHQSRTKMLTWSYLTCQKCQSARLAISLMSSCAFPAIKMTKLNAIQQMTTWETIASLSPL